VSSEGLSLHQMQIPDVPIVVCDVETTGLSPDRNRITDIALVRIVDGEVVDRWTSLVNPRQFIPPEITRLTGITNEMAFTAPEADAVMPTVRRFCEGAIFAGHNVRFDRGFVDASLRRAGIEPLDQPSLCTARLARRLVPTLARKSLGMLARHLGIRISNRHRAGGDADATAQVLLTFLRTLDEEFDLHEVGELLSFQNRPVFKVAGPPRHLVRLREQLAQLPHEPGIYLFSDKRGTVIYVGKARDLHDRVHSYFYHNLGHTEKVMRLVREVHGIEWKTTETELSALLMEARHIRMLQPRFNTMLKRERSLPFIRIDDADDFPRMSWTYDLADDGADYFGPFSSRSTVEAALESMQRLFLLRECETPIRPDPRTNPCLYYEIKRCGAPCAAIQSRDEYLEEVQAVKDFLLGRNDGVLDILRSRMERHAVALNFERAADVRDRIAVIERILRQQRAMTRSIREQNLVIVTPARRTFVEVHCIARGMLVHQELVDQQQVNRTALRAMIRAHYFGTQAELFMRDRDDINEMRIIAFWSVTRRDESVVVDIDTCADVNACMHAVREAITSAGSTRATPDMQAERA
jgi:DNA polymerase III subunit epsilon